MTTTEKRKPRHKKTSEKWYSDGLRFACRKCGGCCTGEPGYVWVTPPDMEKIARHLGMKLDDFTGKYLRRTGSGHSLRELPNGNCIFLNQNTCSIYRARPAQCRTWPFWKSNLSSPEAWDKLCNACPGGGQGRRYSVPEIHRIVIKQKICL